MAINALRQWRPGCPPGELDPVFPNGVGIESAIATSYGGCGARCSVLAGSPTMTGRRAIAFTLSATRRRACSSPTWDGRPSAGHLLDDATARAPEPQSWKPSNSSEHVLGAPRGRYTVRVVDLPAILSQRRPERLLLKLDIEGEETRIIPALFDVLPQEAAVFFETHQGEVGWDWAKQQFTDHGFAVERRRSILDFIDGFALRR